jgi:predicted amidophosphoribosyltransferase
MCETRLQALVCPTCGEPVKEAWKRCPECEALLLCPRCQRRLVKGQVACPQCTFEVQPLAPAPLPVLFSDPICGIEMVRITGGTYQMGDTFGQGMPLNCRCTM